MAHPPGDCAGVECMVDLGTQYCERCGLDRDTVTSARAGYRDCPGCGAACCADCWNLVDGACLVCAPFRLTDAGARPRIVVAAAPAVGLPASTDRYADLRGGDVQQPDTWAGSWGTARQRPKDAAPAGAAPTTPAPDAWRAVLAAASPSAPRRTGRRAGKISLAAAAAWTVVAMLAMVALGASPHPPEAAPPAATPVATPSPVITAEPSPPAATPGPAATPAAPATHAVPGSHATPRPVKPVVVAPPPPAPTAAPAPTPAPTSEESPGADAP